VRREAGGIDSLVTDTKAGAHLPEAVSAEYLRGLNPEQLEATLHFEGPLLVLAGAGSGKTRVLTTRITHLIHEHGVPPERILAVTFTNKAAGEMRQRVRTMLGAEPAGMWMGTFHAVGARLLRRNAEMLGWTRSFSIFDSDQSLRQVKRVQEELRLDPKRWNPQAMRAQISAAKNRLITPERFAEDNASSFDPFVRHLTRVYGAYQKGLAAQNAFDFDDLLVKPVELLERDRELLDHFRYRFAFILVDEYQDTNRAQFRFLELLASEHRNLMVVGDDDQSIYRFRGADIRNILDFEQAFPGARVIRLEQNYRSTETILRAANAVIAENTERKGKTLRTERSGGEKVTLVETADENDEARCVVDEVEARYRDGPALHNYRDFAILYRTNAQSRALEDGFRRRSVPYQIVGGVRFYERREIQDVLAYLRLVSNPKDEGAFERVVNYPRRGVGEKSVEALRAWAREQGIGLLEAAERAGEADVPAGGARGLGAFAALIRKYSARAADARVGVLLQELLEELDLLRLLAEEGPEGEDRADNVKELVAGALDFDAEVQGDLEEGELDTFTELDHFLQRVALVADVDRHDPTADAVTLMTLHNAKGLEFPVVFVTGLEDGLFPLSRAYDEPAELEEERRLFYVGITRAEDKLYLLHARRRRRAGEYVDGYLSPFAAAVPDALVERKKSSLLVQAAAFASYRGGAGAERGSRDIDLDDEPSYDQSAPRYVKGERVVHGNFGLGTIVEVSGFGPDTKVTVDFDTVGRKKLVIRYAQLERDFDY
jgi:DNA helicase-2/ATP-dependent DNA helicase PcrA